MNDDDDKFVGIFISVLENPTQPSLYFPPPLPIQCPLGCVIPNADCGHQLQLITADLHGKRWNNLAIALGKSIAAAKDEAYSVKSDIFDSTLWKFGMLSLH